MSRRSTGLSRRRFSSPSFARHRPRSDRARRARRPTWRFALPHRLVGRQGNGARARDRRARPRLRLRRDLRPHPRRSRRSRARRRRPSAPGSRDLGCERTACAVPGPCGSECDIRADGSLDLPDDVLASLEWVQLSLHAGQRTPRRELTARVTEAMRHPAVRCLSHPTGRLIGHRRENALDLEATITTALETGVALEVNGLPNRLDLRSEHVRVAVEAGVAIVCSTDAHSVTALDNMALAVHTARRGRARAGRPQYAAARVAVAPVEVVNPSSATRPSWSAVSTARKREAMPHARVDAGGRGTCEGSDGRDAPRAPQGALGVSLGSRPRGRCRAAGGPSIGLPHHLVGRGQVLLSPVGVPVVRMPPSAA